MATIFKLIGIVMGFVFPMALIKAIRAKDEVNLSSYIALSCVSFGLIVLTIMFLLPNT